MEKSAEFLSFKSLIICKAPSEIWLKQEGTLEVT